MDSVDDAGMWCDIEEWMTEYSPHFSILGGGRLNYTLINPTPSPTLSARNHVAGCSIRCLSRH